METALLTKEQKEAEQMQRGDVAIKSSALVIFIQGISTTPALLMYGSPNYPSLLTFEYLICLFIYSIVGYLIWHIGDREEWQKKKSFYARKELVVLSSLLQAPIITTIIMLCMLGIYYPHLPGYECALLLGLSSLLGTIIALIALFRIVLLLYRD